MHLRLAFAALTVTGLAACAEGNVAHQTGSAASGTPTAQAAAVLDAAPVKPQGDCDLLTAGEIAQAFAGKLSVRRTSGHGGRRGSCTWSLAELPESQLILQAGDEADHQARKDAYAAQRQQLEPLALGKDAQLVNGAQVIALAADGQSLSLGLTLIVQDAPAPLGEPEIRRGLESLAGIALARL